MTGTTAIDNDVTQVQFSKEDAKSGERLDGSQFRIRKATEADKSEPEPTPMHNANSSATTTAFEGTAATAWSSATSIATSSTKPSPSQEPPKYLSFMWDESRAAYVCDESGEREIMTMDGTAAIERLPKGNYVLEEVKPFDSYVQMEPVKYTVDDKTTTDAPLML